MAEASPQLLLASTSPRRRELLSRAGLTFGIRAPEVDETVRPGEAPEAYVSRLARAKARAVASGSPHALVLAADTSVVTDSGILGKPRDDAEALAMLTSLMGRSHRVLTAVALAGAAASEVLVSTRVWMRPADPEELRWYVQTGEPADKAGAYAIQGIGGQLVSRIEGSYTNVVGLPVAETLSLLEAAGLRLPWRAA
ncbi:MAG TPA: Maf family protein [Myxococcaceae bacterium]|nr:Maf family protein [Myxococcaceae bacterium]